MSKNNKKKKRGEFVFFVPDQGEGAAKGVVIEPEEDGLSITLYVMIRYGFAMAEVAGKVQKAVLAALHDMTGFTIRAVNVMIGGICFD